MAGFRILPTELKFFEWFNKSADNVFEAARVLHGLLVEHRDIESRGAQLTQMEHQGDLIVHEILGLLSRTFLTPIEDDEIRALTHSLDDVLDHIEGAARALLLYKVEQPIPEAIELGRLLVQGFDKTFTFMSCGAILLSKLIHGLGGGGDGGKDKTAGAGDFGR